MKRRAMVFLLSIVCLFVLFAVSVVARSDAFVSGFYSTISPAASDYIRVVSSVPSGNNPVDVTVPGFEVSHYLGLNFDLMGTIPGSNSITWQLSGSGKLVVIDCMWTLSTSINGGFIYVTHISESGFLGNSVVIDLPETRLPTGTIVKGQLSFMEYDVSSPGTFVQRISGFIPTGSMEYAYVPLFSPRQLTEGERLEDLVNGIKDSIDELEEGLLSSPPGWDDYNESVQGVIDGQNSLEASLDAEVNSVFDSVLSDITFDAAAVESGIHEALGDDPGGSSFIRFFQWVWTVNPMLPIEVMLVFMFFLVFLLIRTYP